jgi:hypothetical protein
MGGTLVTDGVIMDGTIHMLGMADGAVKAVLIIAGIMAFTEEGFVATHTMAMVLIMVGITVDTMEETDGEMDLIIMVGTMDGAEMEDSEMQIMVEVILMEAEDITGQIDIIELRTAQENE